MKREEEIRQEMSKIASTHPDWTKNDCMRMGFREGAKWADETMIEKACDWLKEKNQMCMYELEMILGGNFIEDFKKAMDS